VSTLILSTVGTTALTNPYVDAITTGALRRWAKEDERRFAENAASEQALAREIVRVWKIVGAKGAQVPAEIASLGRILKLETLAIGKDDGSRFVFIASDTTTSRSCAHANMLAFREIFKTCSCKPGADGECAHIRRTYLPELQHRNAEAFARAAEGLHGLAEEEQRRFACAPDASKPRWELFNLTGGYKGLIPFATECCNRLNLMMAYLYEESDCLIFKRPKQISALLDPAVQ
jgi:hypothetical protein